MNRKSILFLIVVLSALVVSPAWRTPQDKKDIAAYVIKVVKNVTKSSPASGWTQAVPMDVLKGGQQVRTDEKSFALIKFADETKLLVREKTEVEIKGQIQGKQILDRNVHTTRGNVGFDVKKQEKEAFRFSSPISVASIRGTVGFYEHVIGGGGYYSEENDVDRLGIQSGLATFTNVISNQSVDVGNNQTGVADGQGNLAVRVSTKQETDESGTDVPTTEGEAGGKIKHELRFGAEDRAGNRKTIIITWEE
ncbi:MAG TPA: FecR domain-containing protein [Bacteroidota bacterium]